jgi:hypothetical protein
VSRDGARVAAIEAVTSNPPAGQQVDISLRALAEESFEDIVRKCNEEFPIRVGSALFTKLGKAYWKLPHCRGLPFVLAVGPFHEPGSTAYVDQSLARYLYGVEVGADGADRRQRACSATRQTAIVRHVSKGKHIPSNFFGYASAENVSAVLYCNQFTVPRFFRVAAQADGWPPELEGTRTCWYVDPEDGPINFKYALDHPFAPEESWWQGVTIFHNPRAIHPLPTRALQCSCEFREHEGTVDYEVYGFHTLTSSMLLAPRRS